MNEKLLTYLPYILPVQEQKIDDDVIEITAKHFKTQYGELILNLLHNIDLLPCEEEWIQKKNIDDIIAKICEYSSLSMKYCHGWNINGKLVMISSDKPKFDNLTPFLTQMAQGNVDLHDFFVETKPQPGIYNKFIIAMTFQWLVLLFEKLVSQVRRIEQNEYFNLNVARLFNIVETVGMVNQFSGEFLIRQSRRKGAIERAKLTASVKATIFDIVKRLGLRATDANRINLGATMARVKQEYKQVTDKAFEFKDKTLEKYILDALNNKKSS